LGTQGEYL
jgi:hypothetical protein